MADAVTAPRVTVVIPARNAAATLGAALDALSCQTVPPFEVLVVDDWSSDDTASVARARGAIVLTAPGAAGGKRGLPWVHGGAGVRGGRAERVAAEPLAAAHGAAARRTLRGGGPGPARAHGVKHARGDVIVFTDADCVPDVDFIERLVAPLHAGAAAAKGAYTSAQRGMVPRFVQIEFAERYDRLSGCQGGDFLDGHAVAYRVDALGAAGGVDPQLRLSQNVDLGYRLSRMGYDVRFVPDARTRHTHPETLWLYIRAKAERAFWRVQAYVGSPAKAVHDAYTPASLKVQVILVWVLAALGLFMVRGAQWVGIATIVVGAAFVVSSLPLMARAWRDDRPVTAVVLPLVAARAVALAAGAAAGLLVAPARLIARRGAA